MTFAEIRKNLPPRTLGILIAGAVIAAGFVALFIIPDYHAAKGLRAQIEALRTSIDMRRQLLPVAQSLKQAQAALPSIPPVGGPTHLPLSDVGRLSEIVGALAAPLGLRVTRVSPDPASVTRNRVLAVRLGLLGPPEAFREFLLAMGRYGPLVRVESVSTLVGNEGREYAMKCWLRVK